MSAQPVTIVARPPPDLLRKVRPPRIVMEPAPLEFEDELLTVHPEHTVLSITPDEIDPHGREGCHGARGPCAVRRLDEDA
jgi:hypothetical protein